MVIGDVLRRCDAFAGLPEHALDVLAALAQFRTLRGQEQWVDADTPATAMAVVARGRLRAFRFDRGADTWVPVGDIRARELVGEISVFGDVPTTARVIAVRDSVIIEFPAAALLRSLQDHPQVWPLVTQVMIRRLVQRAVPHPRDITTVCLHPLAGADIRGLARDLRAALAVHGRCAHLCVEQATDRDEDALRALFAHVEDTHDLVLLEAGGDPRWTAACVRQADVVVDVLGPDRPTPVMSPTPTADWQAADLLRVVDRGAEWSTASVIATERYRTVHHTAVGSTADSARLARLLLGRAHGLVLSGGSSRGTAHIGAALALRDAGLEPDIVVGTSAGALIGAMVANRWSEVQMRDALDHLAAFSAVRELQPPFTSLLSGRQMFAVLDAIYGSRTVDETWLPFEAVAADLVTGDVVIPRGTSLRQAVQASSALPGLWPPVPYGDRLLVDGGTVNNLPIDRVLSPCGRGSITACDVATAPLPTVTGTAALPTGWDVLKDRVRGRRSTTIGFVDVVLRAGTMASSAATIRVEHAVTRMIRPDVDVPSSLSARGQIDWLIASGRTAVAHALATES